jgi:type II pantothenate kinase
MVEGRARQPTEARPRATLVAVDVGASLTKTVALRATSVLGAVTTAGEDAVGTANEGLERLLSVGVVAREEIAWVALTGARSSRLSDPLMDLPLHRIDEFRAIGRGGLHLSGLSSAVVASLGTGTAFVAARGRSFSHLGGTALGGGTLSGLALRLLGSGDVEALAALAAEGDLHRVDLYVEDIAGAPIGDLGTEITASNFGKLDAAAAPADVALGLLNLVVQNVALLAAGAARTAGLDRIVLTGKVVTLSPAADMVGRVDALTGIRFTIPRAADYATAIGAALEAEGE